MSNLRRDLILWSDTLPVSYTHLDVYKRQVIYDVKDDAFQKLDRMVMETQTNTSMYGSYGLYISLHYDRSKQILYSIQMNDDNGLYVSAQTNKKVLYNSFLYGDYNDDTYLALSDAASSNSYENIVFSFLNTQRRRPVSYTHLDVYKRQVQGDASWFSQWDQIESSWNYVEQLRQRYRRERLPLATYMAGSAGPKEADELLQRHHHTWSHADV